MMATDLQGGKSARKGWVLTDPAMLCQDLSRFGPTNFDEAQLQMCYEGAQHALEHGLSLEDCLLGSSYAPGFSRHDDGSRFGAARGRADARARLRREKERKKREKKKKKKPAGDLVAPPETVLRVSQGGRLLAEGRSLMEALEICEGLAEQGVFDRRAELALELSELHTCTLELYIYINSEIIYMYMYDYLRTVENTNVTLNQYSITSR